MLALVVSDMAPEALRPGRREIGVAGIVLGAALMWGLSLLLNI
jgi:zinc transporter ZupT